MRTSIVRPQVETTGGEYAFRQGSQVVLARIESRKNRPVNMDMIFTFYADEWEQTVYGGEFSAIAKHPRIIFAATDGTSIARWQYPPSDDGKAARDADLAFLHETFAIKCPKDNSNARR